MGKSKSLGVYLLIALIVFAVFGAIYTRPRGDETKSYTEFMNLVDEGSVKEVKLRGNIVYGETSSGTVIKVVIPNDSQLIQNLLKSKVNIKVEDPDQSSWLVSLFSSIFLPLIIFVALWVLFIRQAQNSGSQAMSFGKSKAKLFVENKPKVTFKDVAGVDEAKQELEEIIEFLKTPQKFQALGAKIPKGVLLVGSPGTGKTLLAKAVAGEAGVPFFNISGSEFVEMFVGVGAARIRDLFEQAKKHSPCLVFIDELDAVGRQRGAGLGGGHDEREQTLNQLLVEMDGFEDNHSTIVLAATNRPDILDSALLRPGRFDRQVVVDKPDIKGREEILGVHVKGKPLDTDIDLKVLAKRTPGFSGADISNFVNEAALLAARYNKTSISMKDMELSIDKVIAGPEKKSRVISEREKEIIAYHEIGHSLVSKFMEHCDPLHKVTIISRGMALGLTMTLPEDRVLTTRKQLMDQIAMLLGGRVAEELIYGEITTGDKNDLERATGLARKMITEFGMSEAIGPITLGKKHEYVFLGRDLGEERNFSEDVASTIDKEIRRLVEENYTRAKNILTEHKEDLIKVAKILIECETLDAEEIEAIIQGTYVAKEKEVELKTKTTDTNKDKATETQTEEDKQKKIKEALEVKDSVEIKNISKD